jgi:hypothetical protein
MRRNMVFALLLAAGVLTAEAQVKSDPPRTRTEPAQEPSENTPAQTETAQEPSDETQARTEKDAKVISGMSILGNQEAPKSLVIVPWKSSEIGKSAGISTLLDESRRPVDKEVFMRELRFYEIRSGTKP